MKIDLKDHQGVQEYLDFLHGEIKTHEATIAEQGAEIAELANFIRGIYFLDDDVSIEEVLVRARKRPMPKHKGDT